MVSLFKQLIQPMLPTDVIVNHIFPILELKQQIELKFISKYYNKELKLNIRSHIKKCIDKHLPNEFIKLKFSDKLLEFMNDNENVSIIGPIILESIHNEFYENSCLDININVSEDYEVNKLFYDLVKNNERFTFKKIICQSFKNSSKHFVFPDNLFKFLDNIFVNVGGVRVVDDCIEYSGNRMIKFLLSNNFCINLTFTSKYINIINCLSFCRNVYSKKGLYISSINDVLGKKCNLELSEFERGLVFYYHHYRSFVCDLIDEYKKIGYKIDLDNYYYCSIYLHFIKLNENKNVDSITSLIDTYCYDYVLPHMLCYNGKEIVSRNMYSLSLNSNFFDGYRICVDGRYVYKYI